MKNLILIILIGGVALAAAGQRPEQKPPAFTKAVQHDEPPMEAPIAPDAKAVAREDLQKDTSALTALMQELGPQLAAADRGVVDKDLPQKLKKLEKLAKRVREDLGR